MAFVQTSEWEVSRRLPKAASIATTASWLGAAQRIVRHFLAVVGSILIHILLLYFFLSKMLGSGGEADDPGVKNENLLLFNLSDGKANEAEKSEPFKEQANQPKATSSSNPSPAPVQEWKMAPMPKSVAASSKPIQTSAEATSAASTSQSALSAVGSTGGGGNYDPYAGAAPQRLMPFQQPASSPPNPSAVAVSARDPLELNQEILGILRKLAKSRGDHGASLILTIEVAPNGNQRNIKLDGGPPGLLASIRGVLKKRPLYRIRTPLTKMEVRQVPLS